MYFGKSNVIWPMINRIKRAFQIIYDPRYRFTFLRAHGFYKNMDDETYIKKQYKLIMKKELDLENPQTYNEKIQWLKLHDRQPEYKILVDKYDVKAFISEKIGSQYVIPTLGIWENADDIDFNSLPNQFVLKGTHDSHHIVICTDKEKLNVDAAREAMRISLKNNYYDYLKRLLKRFK